jgi:hypothetical protein
MRDLDRLKCIQAVLDGDLKPIRAAERLGLTTRIASACEHARVNAEAKRKRGSYCAYDGRLAAQAG